MFQGPIGYNTNMWSTPAVWKQYNKMAVLHFSLVNSTLIYILFSIGCKIIGQFAKEKKKRYRIYKIKNRQTSKLTN